MPDPVMLSGARAKRLAWPSPLALELTGGSAVIARVQELLRRAAALDTACCCSRAADRTPTASRATSTAEARARLRPS